MCCLIRIQTCRVCGWNTTGKHLKVLEFTYFCRFFNFGNFGISRQKYIKNEITVFIAIPMAGFISVEWLPVFVNYRRDGYDFDALYEDGKAPLKHKKIMDNFIEDKLDSEILSNQLKVMTGFGKDGEKGFEGAVTTLMMQLYLCNSDFRKRKNKKGQEYGWNVAAYCAPEHLWGYDTVTASYREDSKVS